MSLVSGTRLGPYEIVSPIGAGGMGEVYKARDTRLGREVAVKVLPAEFASEPERLRRFEQEARAAAALNHPNILVLYDIGSTVLSLRGTGSPEAISPSPPGLPRPLRGLAVTEEEREEVHYIVTELLEGEPLRKRIAAGPLPVSKVVDYGAQVAEGLAAAHEKGIVHRDLKPENLWVTRDGRVKILDFGLARLTLREPSQKEQETEMPTADSPTRQGVVMGTMGYMAPEQLRGALTDARTDIFAFGCVLYEMVSGQKAFTGTTQTDIAASILKEEPPDLQATGRPVPMALDRIVMRCLEKRPEQRFQSARDLAFDLEAFSGLTGPGSGPGLEGTKGTRPSVWSFRRWAVVSAFLVAVAVVAAALFVALRAAAPAPQPTFQAVTFRRGGVANARFSLDGRDVRYTGFWDGKPAEGFSVRLGSPEARSLGPGFEFPVGEFPNGDLLLQQKGGMLCVAPPGGGAPRAILEDVYEADAGPDPQHILVLKNQSGVWRLEYPIGKVLFETRQYIAWPRLSHKGDRVAFLLWPALGVSTGAEVMIVDASGKVVMASKGWEAVGMAWTPSDDEVWFWGKREGQNAAVWALTTGGRARLVYRPPIHKLIVVDISRDGKALFMSLRERWGFAAWDAAAGEERDLSWFDSSNVTVLSPDGSRVLFHEDGAGVEGKVIFYMRGTDGSPPVRLGEGYAMDLSPDGQWVIVSEPNRGSRLVPTGAGQARALSDKLVPMGCRFTPDGRRVVFLAGEPGKKPRFFVQPVEGGTPKAITKEGNYSAWMAVSPDGRDLAFRDEDAGRVFLAPIDGGQPRPLAGEQFYGSPISFTTGGRALLVNSGRRIFRVDLSTGRRTLVREVKAPDKAGFVVQWMLMTPDEKAYAYQYIYRLSDLFVAEGLK